MKIMGYRKFLLGVIGLAILVASDLVLLWLLLSSIISGEQFVEFCIEVCKVIGIIVSAFMAANIGKHIVDAVKEKVKK